MKKKATVFRCLMLLLLALVTALSCCIGAMAIGFSADSFVGSGGGSALNNVSFSVRSANAADLVVGYRFAGILANGNLVKPSIPSVDIILSSKYAYIDGASNGDPLAHSRLIPQWSKYQYFKEAWGKNTTRTNPVSYDILSAEDVTGWDDGKIYKEDALGFETALPKGDLSNGYSSYDGLDDALDAWQGEDANIHLIAELVGFEDLTNLCWPRLHHSNLILIRSRKQSTTLLIRRPKRNRNSKSFGKRIRNCGITSVGSSLRNEQKRISSRYPTLALQLNKHA